MKLAYDIVESFDKYASLPTSFDIHEYDMMERFCYSLSDQKKQDILLNAIRGKGAFRRFNFQTRGLTPPSLDGIRF